MWEQIVLFCKNPIILGCLFSWLCAQFIKTIINLAYGKIHSVITLLEFLFWRTGGLPSSHSALVTCLCTMIGFKDGISSDCFMVSLAFLLVTIRDALGVRRSSGLQAKKLNEIGNTLNEKGIVEYSSLKEVNGHTPMEVLLGCLLGFFVGLAFSVL